MPTVMLGAPAPQVVTASAGVKPGGFGFTIIGVVNQTIVVEASANLRTGNPSGPTPYPPHPPILWIRNG